MNKRRIAANIALAITLTLCLLLSTIAAAAPQTVAIPVNVAGDGEAAVSLKMAKSATTMYKSTSTRSGKVAKLAKYDVVQALEEAGSFTKVNSGGKHGFVQTKQLMDITAAATPKALLLAKADTPVFAAPNAQADKLGSVPAGAILPALLELDGWSFLLQDGKIGAVETKLFSVLNSKTQKQGSATAKASVNIYAAASTASRKLTTVKKGRSVDLLGAYDETWSVVRSGKHIGFALNKSLNLPAAEPTAGDTETHPPTGPTGPATENYNQDVLTFIGLINEYRVQAGLNELTIDPELMRAAEVRARECHDKFSHTRPDGSSFSTVSAAAKGENIAKAENSVFTPYTAARGFYNSPPHKSTMLNTSFTTTGAARYVIGDNTYWVQLFGRG